MIKRTLSAVIGIPIFIFIVYRGGNLLLLSIIIVTMTAIDEYIRSFEKSIENINEKKELYYYRIWLWFSTLLSYAVFYYTDFKIEFEAPFIFVVILGIAFIEIIHPTYETKRSRDMIYGYIYITVFFRFVYYTAQIENGFWVWLIFLIAWSTDTFAYFTGLLLGRNKLAPEISPKKTIEGAIGGVLGSALCTFAYATVFIPQMSSVSIIFGVFGSIVSQIGDLNASIIKRRNGVKDFGNLIPGHGGILDRFDSILFTAPFVYVLYIFLHGMGVIR